MDLTVLVNPKNYMFMDGSTPEVVFKVVRNLVAKNHINDICKKNDGKKINECSHGACLIEMNSILVW